MRSSLGRALAIGAVFLLIWLLIRYLMPLVLPFLLGLGLAAAAEPVVGLLCRRLHLHRVVASGIAVTMAFCFLVLLMSVFFALLVRELGALAGVIPDLEDAARNGATALESWLLNLSSYAPESMESVLHQNITGFFSDSNALLDRGAAYMLNLAGTILGHVPDSALGVGTTVIAGYMISAKLPSLRAWVLNRFPLERLKPLLETLRRLRKTAFRWIVAQLQLSGVTLGILTVGFLLLRVGYAPLCALAVALVDAFPVLGTGTVLLPWCLVCLLQDEGARALGLLGIYIVVSVTRSVLEPKLLGRQLGLDPLLTLMAIYAGYKLWGIGGMLLAPLATVTAMQLIPGAHRTEADG